MSKILGHIGELLDEYRELGAVLESGQAARPFAPQATSTAGREGGEQQRRRDDRSTKHNDSDNDGDDDDDQAGGPLSARQQLLKQRFETTRQNSLRAYRNFAKEQPYETARYYITQVRAGESGVGGGEKKGGVASHFLLFCETR